VIALRNARLVLPSGPIEAGTLLIQESRIIDIGSPTGSAAENRDLRGAWVVPGFIDVHVHGLEGIDTLDGATAIGHIACRLPKYGVTAFCPTTVACAPRDLDAVLATVERLRGRAAGARVLGAHLESNFISHEYRGAQPAECLRLPPPLEIAAGPATPTGASRPVPSGESDPHSFSGAEILEVIDRRPGTVAIMTLAPELPGALPLIRWLRQRDIRVSLGHSGASYEEAVGGMSAGATQATHLFNRMSPLHHRDPGLAGAVLERADVAAELICDGFHVHPSAARLAIRLKGPDCVLAITDGTAAAGLPSGAAARLGGRRIRVAESAALLDDGTLAGSTLTMDRAFRNIVQQFQCSVAEAARLCATTPARVLGLDDQGALLPGRLADFVVLDAGLEVVETWVHGRCLFAREHPGPLEPR
jgi:N-acetylglucosamine-6-phosphate deacetylase